ncbi:MAG: hypothetical protein FRX49_05163 [Trebouxia sp. A1-2]|nr:MAG: hypothetical protein FRX49_05163 [Trebouxia sp. A1-2]
MRAATDRVQLAGVLTKPVSPSGVLVAVTADELELTEGTAAGEGMTSALGGMGGLDTLELAGGGLSGVDVVMGDTDSEVGVVVGDADCAVGVGMGDTDSAVGKNG